MITNAFKSALLVEDDENLRTFLRLTLRESGIDLIHEAVDADAAVRSFRSHRPLLSVLDLGIQRGSALDVLRRIRAINEECLIVVLTTPETECLAEDCLEAGADSLLPRASEPAPIVAAIRSLLADAVWSS